jgi:hypothetical protein
VEPLADGGPVRRNERDEDRQEETWGARGHAADATTLR